MHKGSLFSYSCQHLLHLGFFGDNHPDRCEVISDCVLICNSLMISDLSIFSCACRPFVYLLWKNNYSEPLSIFKLVWFSVLCVCFVFVFVLLLSYMRSLHAYFGCECFVKYMIYKNILFCMLSFAFVDGFFCCSQAF